MNVITILKSIETYKRIKIQVDYDVIEWNPHIEDIEQVQEKIAVVEFDLAIVDEKVWWAKEAVSLFKSFDVPIVYFQGDFEEVNKEVAAFVPEEEDDSYLDFPLSEETSSHDGQVKIIEREKIIEKEVEVPVFQYRDLYTNIPQKLIVVTNLSSRAGSTFTTVNIAKALSKRNILTAVAEPPINTPYIFDMLGLHLIDENLSKPLEEIYSIPHEIRRGNRVKRGNELIYDGISWLVGTRAHGSVRKWTYEHMMKLIYSTKASITLLDVGSNFYHDSVQEILSELDQIFVIVDPLPQEILNNDEAFGYFQELKAAGHNVEFIFNRWNDGVDAKLLREELEMNIKYKIPFINPTEMYRASYLGHIPYSVNAIKSDLELPIHQILKSIVPPSFLIDREDEVIKKGIIKNLFKKKQKVES